MRKILLCLDGSQYGRSCTLYAAWLARRTGASVDALYVSELWQFETPLIADFGGSIGAQPYLALTSQLQEIEKQKAETLREAMTELFKTAAPGVRPVLHHRTGVLVDCVEEFEKEESPPDFILVGKRGEDANFAKSHLGPNMERVVRAASLPVFVANRVFSEPTTVLLAYDGGESTRRALEWINTSGALVGLKLHVVTVARTGEEALASSRIAEAERLLGGERATYQVLGGAPGEAVAQYAVDNGVDLLVMGAYGHSAIRRLIIGSTTTEILRDCRIPAILFR